MSFNLQQTDHLWFFFISLHFFDTNSTLWISPPLNVKCVYDSVTTNTSAPSSSPPSHCPFLRWQPGGTIACPLCPWASYSRSRAPSRPPDLKDTVSNSIFTPNNVTPFLTKPCDVTQSVNLNIHYIDVTPHSSTDLTLRPLPSIKPEKHLAMCVDNGSILGVSTFQQSLFLSLSSPHSLRTQLPHTTVPCKGMHHLSVSVTILEWICEYSNYKSHLTYTAS